MMIVYGITLIALSVVLLLILELLFSGSFGLGIWERLSRLNTPSLPHNIVGCTARYAGSELINSLLICAASKYRHYDPAEPSVDLNGVSLQHMDKNRKDYGILYTTKHYSDFLVYAPILQNYRAVAVARHPLDRIIVMVNQFKASATSSSSQSKPSWTVNSAIYEHIGVSNFNHNLTFEKYILELTNSDALLYGIYVSSLFFMEEIVELAKIKSKGLDIIRLEDLLHNSSKHSLEKISKVLSIESNVVKECAPLFINDDRKLGNMKYAYNGNYECKHYLYFEKLIGENALKDFGYEDDLLNYNEAKRLACKRDSKGNSDAPPMWPKFNFPIFNASFDGYEYKLKKLNRIGGGKTELLTKLDKIKAENHELIMMAAANSSIKSLSDSKVLNPAELEQIAANSRFDLFCPVQQGNLTYNQAQTRQYLTFIKGTKEYSNLPAKDKKKRITDSSFPFEQPDSWIQIFCPEVPQFFRDYKVSYFDFYPSDHTDPLTTTEAAATMICLLKVIDHLARSLDASWAMFAGTQLGAVLHGGPIPWDDDIDIIVDGNKVDALIEKLLAFKIGKYKFACSKTSKAARCYVDDSSYWFYRHKWNHHWPFIDLFSFYANDEVALEYALEHNQGANRRLNSKAWRIEDFAPFRLTFYGGIMIPSLRLETSMLHYDVNMCINGLGSHRIDKYLSPHYQSQLNCCVLAEYFPFIRRFRSKYEPGVDLEVLMIKDRPVHVSRVNIETGQVINSFYLKSSQQEASKSFLRNSNRSNNSSLVTVKLTYTHHNIGTISAFPNKEANYNPNPYLNTDSIPKPTSTKTAPSLSVVPSVAKPISDPKPTIPIVAATERRSTLAYNTATEFKPLPQPSAQKSADACTAGSRRYAEIGPDCYTAVQITAKQSKLATDKAMYLQALEHLPDVGNSMYLFRNEKKAPPRPI